MIGRRPARPPVSGETGYDVVVIGSGFGGAVTALRLTEKGYRVAILEAGRRFDPASLPATSWAVRSFLWAPRLRCFGIQRIRRLRGLLVLSGAGVGGGSLVYANTLCRPLPDFYADRQWRAIADWQAELAPYYDLAERMLGVDARPPLGPADEAMRLVARDLGVEHTFAPAAVGVCFGPPGTRPGTDLPDPYFGGAGPPRRSCLGCGECMTGCRHGAKNTLTENYLYLAEAAGATVHPLTTATAVRPLPGGGYAVDSVGTERRRRRVTFTAAEVVLAAGTLGTQELLHRMVGDGRLTGVSPRLGTLTRTNSEALVGAVTSRSDADYSRGIAIGSAFQPDPQTRVEPVRYGRGSNLMGLLSTVYVEGSGRWPRSLLPLRWLATVVRHPGRLLRSVDLRGWSQRSVIALVMQAVDNSVTVVGRGGGTRGRRFRLSTVRTSGEPAVPVTGPVAGRVAAALAARIGGWPAGSVGAVAGVPMTAHILGGCPIGADPESGVLDGYLRVFGQPGLHVVDGAAISANLGANPSLTITAQAERAMAFWPNRGDPDPRPSLGTAYRPVSPVAPRTPAVPAGAPAALRRGPDGAG